MLTKGKHLTQSVLDPHTYCTTSLLSENLPRAKAKVYQTEQDLTLPVVLIWKSYSVVEPSVTHHWTVTGGSVAGLQYSCMCIGAVAQPPQCLTKVAK